MFIYFLLLLSPLTSLKHFVLFKFYFQVTVIDPGLQLPEQDFKVPRKQSSRGCVEVFLKILQYSRENTCVGVSL